MSNTEEIQNEGNDVVEEPQTAQAVDPKDEEIQQLTDKWKRTAADFENFKRRKESEAKELIGYSKEMIVAQLMPSLQNLEQVLKFAPTDEKYKDWLAGLKATIIQLEKAMEDLGLVKIKTVGEQFDPNLHEAVEESESESPGILKEVQPGYTLNGKVIIPAKVVVGKNKN